ncbi:hypothetical protein X743_17825 [Mesorhizobium sp. LNHC252B00]|nr:hypothetical protein X743_17825 [Mesorhizobium sp. LNHC252B00]
MTQPAGNQIQLKLCHALSCAPKWAASGAIDWIGQEFNPADFDLQHGQHRARRPVHQKIVAA